MSEPLHKSVLIEAQYFPPLAWFATLLPFGDIQIEKHEHFIKQTYRNRCYINTASGVEMLTVPLTEKHGKTKITDIRIDYRQKWLNNHWRTIQSAYAAAPFFEYYAPDVHDALFKRHDRLYDLNLNLLTMCLGWLKWSGQIRESETYEKTLETDVIDLRSAINAKKEEDLERFYSPVIYAQVFGSSFVSNLSILDLIFCQGPEAGRILKASAGK